MLNKNACRVGLNARQQKRPVNQIIGPNLSRPYAVQC